VLALGVTLVASAAFAKRTGTGALYSYEPTMSTTSPTWDNSMSGPNGLNTSASANTTLLYSQRFEVGASCTQGGWTKVDATAQPANFWHVDDFNGMNPVNYSALAGTKSLWCGARPAATGPLCGYAALPGYGNSWNQAFCTKACIAVSGDGILDVNFLARFDSEPSYDATELEYTLDCTGASGWTVIDGGTGVWDGLIAAGAFGGAYNIGTTGPVKVRLHFEADGAWSDEDGLWNTNGAVVVDNLGAEGLAVEDFEGEAVNATQSNDWITCNPAGYGQYMALFPGASMLQQDPCAKDLLCLWAAIDYASNPGAPVYDYSCGGFPLQQAVPFGNADGQYLNNDIWSPDIALGGSGSVVNLEFAVYRDMALDNLIFYTWGVRTTDNTGCASGWKDRNYVYYGGQKDWLQNLQAVGDLLNLTTGVSMNIRLGVMDMCGVWCGTVGSGACHSHAPLIDNFKVYRVDAQGAQWAIRDIDQFNDTFEEIVTGPRKGTGEVRTIGKAGADMANDITPGANYDSNVPGDSSVVKVADPVAGLGLDVNNSRAAVYLYAHVQPTGQAAKTGSNLTTDPVRYPYRGTWTDAGGNVWDIVQLDSSIVNNVAQPDIYCVDLNDNIFEAGDTISFFYGAVNSAALETYAYGSALGAQTSDREAAAAAPSEFTVLPAGGVANGGDILYVDGMDGRGAQPYFDTAFQSLGLFEKIDRYDVRGPSSGVSNRPAGRVKDIAQLVPTYRKIIWDTGDLDTGLGNGSTTPEKTNDYKLVNSFLANLSPSGGVYIAGDDVPQVLDTYQSSVHPNGVDAIAFKSTYLPFNLTSANHRPSFGISPIGTAVAGGMFVSDATMVLYGGCPLINDFDVIEPQGTTVNQMTYGAGTPASTNGAVVSNIVGSSRVVFGGFSFIYIRDNDNNGRMDRADFMYDVITFLQNTPSAPTPVASGKVNSLQQNYPNPFNPQTTIAFSIKDRGLVTLKVYNVAGELVRTIADEQFTAGSHTKVWDGRNDAGQPVSSGVYFYKLVSNNFTQTKKMVLLK